MSLRTSLLRTVNKLMALPGPTGFDVLTSEIRIRTRTWSGGQVRLGTSTDSDIVITPRPELVFGDATHVKVIDIVPANADGGYTPQQLNPPDVAGVETFYVITGPDGVARDYAVLSLDKSDPFAYNVALVALERRIPF